MRYYFVIAILCCAFISHAQHWLGISSSNYAGTHALFQNPAHAADNRHKLYINLVANDFFLINNYLAYNAPYSFLRLITNTVQNKYRNDRGLIIWRDTYYKERLNGNLKHLHTGGDLRGPSALFAFNQNKMSVGFTTRARYLLSLNNVSESTARVIRYGTNKEELQNVPYTNQTAWLNTNGTIDLGATFGTVLANYDEDFIKIGATVKRVIGFYNLHANIKNADYIIREDNLSRREFIQASILQAQYGYTTDEAFQNVSLNPSFLFGNRSAGGGWGIDIGAVYEYRPDIKKYQVAAPKGGRYADPNQNKYKYRIAIALNDIGRIAYKNPNYVQQVSIDTTNITFSYTQFNNLKSSSGATNALNNSTNATISHEPYIVGLPTSFNISFDYNYQKKLYINAVWVQSLRAGNNRHIKSQSVFAITPRYETRWFEVAMPFSLLDNYRVFSVGLATRIGPLLIGTDHLGGLLNIGTPQGIDFYFGLHVPFFHTKPKDPNKCWFPPYEPTYRRKNNRRI